MGCDQCQHGRSAAKCVSIHAPVWGATHRSPMMLRAGSFQSTHPCGVRQANDYQPKKQLCFNPRTRVGCDPQIRVVRRAAQVSIHAPVWGATFYYPKPHYLTRFQSTHPCGVRHDDDANFNRSNVSIHAPVWGATASHYAHCHTTKFQSTHPCGVRRAFLFE